MHQRHLIIAMLACLLAGSRPLRADEPIDYTKQIKPLFATRCVACHGALKQEGGLRLDTAALAIRGGDHGAALVPGNASASQLLARVSATDPAERMPAEGEPLLPDQVAALTAWIAQGARAPADDVPERDPREHWAFHPILRPQVGAITGTWAKNAIDALVAQVQNERGVVPQREASREQLVRRLFLDLVGLPPTDDEQREVDADRDDQWYERLTDRLLDDPRHGQRWARHWMDIWRYSDWWGLGDQLRNSQPHIWHWRDWIVESLNADLPYDEMVRLMLAADELYPNDLDKLRASGFLARNYFLFNRNQWMDETVEHVGKAFLGLTMNCAKCHDHKYDPIEQTDYYRMRAFFEPYHARIDVVPHEPDLSRDGIPRAFDGQLDAPTYRFIRGQESQPDKSVVLGPDVPHFLARGKLEITPVRLPVDAWQPERRAWVGQAHLEASEKKVAAAQAALAMVGTPPAGDSAGPPAAAGDRQLAQLELDVALAEKHSLECRIAALRASWATVDDPQQAARQADEQDKLTFTAVQAERQAELAKARRNLASIETRLAQAAADKREPIEKQRTAATEQLDAATKKAASDVSKDDRFTPLVGAKWTPTRFFNSTADDPAVTFAQQSTGRRTALAKWITAPRNPLTARVAVNHLWARHLGTPLVATVFDFGRKGDEPAGRALLDWLAAELIDSGWSMKHMHRLIVGSATYRLSSSVVGREANLAKDAQNASWWRRTPIRLESQLVRDAILQLAGHLDVAHGGPPVLPAGQAESRRRSLYFFHSNNDRNLLLSTFDEATVKECYRRDDSIVPQQALALSNSRLVLDAAPAIAARLSQPPQDAPSAPATIDDATFATRAFRGVLGVSPSEAEQAACVRALAAWKRLPAQEGLSPRACLVWTLLNHNDFVTLR